MTLSRYITFSALFVVAVCAVLCLNTSKANAITYSLSVISDHGTPSPPVGVRIYQDGMTVFCSVDAYLQIGDGERAYCTGWTGTGSVPATGDTNTMHFIIRADSVLTWVWKTYYELTVSCQYPVACIPAIGGKYYPEGQAIDLGAPLFHTDLLFDGYAGNGEIATGSAHYVSIELNTPSSITWFYRTANLTSTPKFEGSYTIVDSSPLVGKFASIAINPQNGHPSTAYFDEKNGDLRFAYFNGTEWKWEIADDGLLVGQYARLIYDSNNSPVILYYSYGYRDLKIARRDIEGNWYNDLIDSANQVGSHCDITLLPGARLGVSYYDETNGALLYREYQDGFWIPEPHLVLDNDGNTGTYSAIATNPITGEPAVAYRSETNDCVYFIYRDSGIWHRQQVTSTRGTGYFIDLEFDSNGTPYIVYQDNRNNPRTIDVYIAHQAGEVWISQLVNSSGDVGFYNTLAIDSSNYPHVAYYDDTARGLRYSFWNGRFWISEVIDIAGSHVGRYCAITLDRNGLPNFVYWADEKLRYNCATGWGPAITEPPAPSVIVRRDTSGGGCFIATAAFGSIAQESVVSLCSYRDTYVSASEFGMSLISAYYHLSPSVADSIRSSVSLSSLAKSLFNLVD